MSDIKDVRHAKAAARAQLLQLGLGGNVISRRATISVNVAVANAGRNVHAVGIGRKWVDGAETDELAVRIYVVQKLPESLLSPRDRLPTQIDGVPTDVFEADPAFLLAPRAKAAKKGTAKPKRTPRATTASVPPCSANRWRQQRPLIGGISSGHRDITAGTLGCFCRSLRAGDDDSVAYALSNNHVYANVNQALIGDPLYQPGPADGGDFHDHFANLHRYVDIKLGGTQPNHVDAAIGGLLGNIGFVPEICSIGQLSGTLNAEEGMLVRKHGRTTGYTEGRIDDIEYDALIGMDHNDPSVSALFEDQLRIVSTASDPFGLGGDSGSTVIHRTENSVVGLYFAGPANGMYGVANKVEHVVTELEIEII